MSRNIVYITCFSICILWSLADVTEARTSGTKAILGGFGDIFRSIVATLFRNIVRRISKGIFWLISIPFRLIAITFRIVRFFARIISMPFVSFFMGPVILFKILQAFMGFIRRLIRIGLHIL